MDTIQKIIELLNKKGISGANLHDGVVAFGQVKQLAQKILDDGNPIIKKKFEAYLNMELPNVGYVCICIPDIVKPYLDEVGLGEWLE